AVYGANGQAEGVPALAQVTVVNRDPAGTVKITPSIPFTNGDVVAELDVYDPDPGDRVRPVFSWWVNGQKVAHNTDTINGVRWFDRDDQLQVEVVLYDDYDGKRVINSPPVIVGNTPPSPPALGLRPVTEDAYDIFCSVVAPATDDDFDPVTYSMTWTVDGAPFEGETRARVWPGDTVPSAASS